MFDDQEASELIGRWTARGAGHVDTVAPRMVFETMTVKGGAFRGVVLEQFASIGGRFEGCLFESMNIRVAEVALRLFPSVYVDCSFDHSCIGSLGGGLARFERCSFRDVSIGGWLGQTMDVIDCVFSGMLRHGRFFGRPESLWEEAYGKQANEFLGNDFSECTLVDVTFSGGVDLAAQVLPIGDSYAYMADGRNSLERVSRAIQGWPEDGRRAAQLVLDALRGELQGGQEQLFVGETMFADPSIWPAFRDVLAGS